MFETDLRVRRQGASEQASQGNSVTTLSTKTCFGKHITVKSLVCCVSFPGLAYSILAGTAPFLLTRCSQQDGGLKPLLLYCEAPEAHLRLYLLIVDTIQRRRLPQFREEKEQSRDQLGV